MPVNDFAIASMLLVHLRTCDDVITRRSVPSAIGAIGAIGIQLEPNTKVMSATPVVVLFFKNHRAPQDWILWCQITKSQHQISPHLLHVLGKPAKPAI